MPTFVLGSQSPQRRRLLESLVGTQNVVVVPPQDDNEPGFEGLTSSAEIEGRLRLVVDGKVNDIVRQLRRDSSQKERLIQPVIVCADTVVVCTDEQQKKRVLGKPPELDWQATVSDWFTKFYSGATHEVWTGFAVQFDDVFEFQIVKSTVSFPVLTPDWIQWYMSTEEPIGKAGGYGIQGHAAAFVQSIQGSLTTIIGLPLRELAAVFSAKTGWTMMDSTT